MSMVMARYVAAGIFKAQCLALLDEVADTGTELVVTKRGRPIARVVPLDDGTSRDLAGSVRYRTEEDLIGPVAVNWDAES